MAVLVHLEIRPVGVQHLRDNSEQFIESNVEISWLEYLTNISCNMSMQGTWADHVIIQAVADAMNLIIHVIESVETFSDVTCLKSNVKVAMFEIMQCKVACLKCNVKVAMFEMQC